MNPPIFKLVRPEIKTLDAANHDYLVTLSAETKDRDGDTITSAGWELDSFNAHPVLLSSHDYTDLRKQIGEWKDMDKKGGALRGVAHYYVGEGNAEADWAAKLAAMKRAAYSVGFEPLEFEPIKGGGIHYLKQELLEGSHVTIPSNREALQLMAKGVTVAKDSVRAKLAEELLNQKWSSNQMDPDSDNYWGPADVHCIVPGCDDACQIQVPVCAEHLKVLVNADAEPPGGELDENAEMMLRMLRGYGRRMLKAGKPISGSNMSKVHTALDAMHSLHDAGNCSDDSCPYGDSAGDGSDDNKSAHSHKAMAEGSGDAGGAAVSDSGTHGAFDGSHTHPHAANGGPEDMHDGDGHEHSHDGDGNHNHAHSKSAAEVEQKQESATTQGRDPAALAKSLENAMEAALEGIKW